MQVCFLCCLLVGYVVLLPTFSINNAQLFSSSQTLITAPLGGTNVTAPGGCWCSLGIFTAITGVIPDLFKCDSTCKGQNLVKTNIIVPE